MEQFNYLNQLFTGILEDDQKRQGRGTEFTEAKVRNSSASGGSSIYSTLSGEP